MKPVVFLVPIMLVCLATVGSHAQVGAVDPEVQASQFQSVLVEAMDTALVENGKLRSLKINLPDDRVRTLTLEHATDNRSFTMVEDGRRIQVVVDEFQRISEIVFPNGKSVKYEWVKAPTGYWVPSTIRVDGKQLLQGSNGLSGDDCRPICERAAQATVIAAGVCLVQPLTLGCWTATAVATAATYQCYRCTHPEIEEPPQSLFDFKRKGRYESYELLGERYAQARSRDHTDRRWCDLLDLGEIQ